MLSSRVHTSLQLSMNDLPNLSGVVKIYCTTLSCSGHHWKLFRVYRVQGLWNYVSCVNVIALPAPQPTASKHMCKLHCDRNFFSVIVFLLCITRCLMAHLNCVSVAAKKEAHRQWHCHHCVSRCRIRALLCKGYSVTIPTCFHSCQSTRSEHS